MNKNISTGIFLRLDSTEDEDLKEFFKSNDYEYSPDGLKKFVMDSIYADEPDSSPILDAIRENPELIKGAAGAIGQFASRFFRRR